MINSVLVEFFIKTNAKKSLIIFDTDLHKYLVFVKSVPVKGKANKEIVNLLKEYFKASDAILVKGVTSSTKIFEIRNAQVSIQK